MKNKIFSALGNAILDIRSAIKPETAIDSAFKKTDHRIPGVMALLKTGSIKDDFQLKMDSMGSLIRLRKIRSGKDGNAVARGYIDGVDDTKGDYRRRDKNIRYNVSIATRIIKLGDSHRDTKNMTILDLLIKIDSMLNNGKFIKAFRYGYDEQKKGNEVGEMITSWYLALVWTIETLTIFTNAENFYVGKGSFSYVNHEFFKRNPEAGKTIRFVAELVVLLGDSKDPLKFFKELSDTKRRSMESYSDEVSTEDLTMALVTVVGIGMGIYLATHGVRSAIYHISCLKVDIGESLRDQTYTLMVNISDLEKKLETLDPKSKEYAELSKVIDKQTELTERLKGIAERISESELESIDDIREKEIEDSEIVRLSTTEDEDDDILI